MARRWIAGALGVLFSVAPLAAAAADPEVERLVRLARVWAAVKYLHPAMLQREIDWDGALVRAVPPVRTAATADDFEKAIASMLSALGDPATRVIEASTAAAPAAPGPIVSDAPLDDAALAATTLVDLGGARRAVVRIGQPGSTGVAADVVAADPLAEALAIMEGRKRAPRAPAAATGRAPAELRWRPDAAYAGMQYPDVAYRLLAAFRIWSVIH